MSPFSPLHKIKRKCSVQSSEETCFNLETVLKLSKVRRMQQRKSIEQIKLEENSLSLHRFQRV